MKKLLLALSLMVGCASAPVETPNPKTPVVNVQKAEPVAEPKEQEELKEIDWQPFSPELLKVSLAMDKPVLLYIKDEGCFYCQKMSKSTFSNSVVVKTVNEKFIPTTLDIQEDAMLASVFYAQDEGVAVPRIVFMQPSLDGKLVMAISDGYLNQYEFVNIVSKAEAFLKQQLNADDSDEESTGKYKGVSGNRWL